MTYKGSQATKGSNAVRRLIELGVIPPECVRFELIFDVGDVIRATCTFNVTEDQLEKIAQAYEENPDDAAGIIREFVRPGKGIGSAPEARIPEFGKRD
jgi:hypothetical protein